MGIIFIILLSPAILLLGFVLLRLMFISLLMLISFICDLIEDFRGKL